MKNPVLKRMLVQFSPGNILFLSGLLVVLTWYGRQQGTATASWRSDKRSGKSEIQKHVVQVAILTPYPPLPHGIGEWVHDQIEKGVRLVCPCDASAAATIAGACPVEYRIIAVQPAAHRLQYPPEVDAVVREGYLEDFLAAAELINANFDVLSIQHEFGIFGGPHADDILLQFLDRIQIPISVNFHTVVRPPHPVAVELQVHLREVLLRVDHVAAFLPSLCAFHHTTRPSLPCSFIPHGHERLPPSASLASARAPAPDPRLAGRTVLLSLGYLTPDKGLHFAVEALSVVVQQHPALLYVIAGGPSLGHTGEYLRQLQAQVREAHLQEHVLFVGGGQALPKEEVRRWFARADIVLAPHTWQHQISSGTVSMAMGLGKVVVSSAFPFAQELMCNGTDLNAARRGTGGGAEPEPDWNGDLREHFKRPRPCWTVPFDARGRPDRRALALTLSALLASPALRRATARLALQRVRGSSWPELAHRHMALYRWMAGRGREKERRQLGGPAGAPRRPPPEPWTNHTVQRGLAARAAALRGEKPAGSRALAVRLWVTPEDLLGISAGEEGVRLLMEGFVRGPLMFRRWLPRPPRTLPGPLLPVESPAGEADLFHVSNGLVCLRGNLRQGVVTLAVLEPGEALGYGVQILAKAVYTVGETWTHATLEGEEPGARWGVGDGAVWREVPLRGGRAADAPPLGSFRASFRLLPGTMRLEASYRVTMAPHARLPWVEVAVNSHYGDRKPEHNVFRAFRGGHEVLSAGAAAEGEETLYDVAKDDVAPDWDVALSRGGERALFTLMANASLLKFVTQGPRGPPLRKTFQHLYHRYVVPKVEPGGTVLIAETKALVSRVAVNHLQHYRSALTEDDLVGFDIGFPTSVHQILNSLDNYASSLDFKDPLASTIKKWIDAFLDSSTCKESLW